MTREQLSQLLLVYITMASDSLDAIDSLMYLKIGEEYNYVVSILILYTFAHFLYGLNLTVVLDPDSKYRHPEKHFEDPTKRKLIKIFCFPFNTDMWVMLITLSLQDGPFLVLRMFLIFEMKIITFANILFAVKNGVLALMDIYRISAILLDMMCIAYHHHQQDDSDDEDDEEYVKDPLDDFLENDDRLEFRMSIDHQNTMDCSAQFIVASNKSDDGETIRRKKWRTLSTRTSLIPNDRRFRKHLLYEVDVVVSQEALDNIFKQPLVFKDVGIKNLHADSGSDDDSDDDEGDNERNKGSGNNSGHGYDDSNRRHSFALEPYTAAAS